MFSMCHHVVIVLFSLSIYLALSMSQNHHADSVKEKLYVFNMAEEFGKQHNVKSWTLHCELEECLQWKHLYQSFIKENGNNGYFSSNVISATNSSKSTRPWNHITLHIYVSENIAPLTYMLDQEMITQTKDIYSSPKKFAAYSNIWLIKLPELYNETNIREWLDEAPLRFDTMAFGFTILKNYSIEIYDMYKVDFYLPAIVKKCGTWTPKNGLEIDDHEIWSRRSSLEGFHLKVASIYSPPFVHCVSNNCFKGLFADVWDALAVEMNFTYTPIKEYYHGSFTNGSWIGSIGKRIILLSNSTTIYIIILG